MKIKFALMWGAACALSGVAGAQAESKATAPEFRPGLAPSEYERELPALPKLDPTSRARTEIRVLQTSRGEVYQVEAVRQSIGDILRTITTGMGVRAIIDPKLDDLRLEAVAFRANSWERLLDNIGVMERWKSASGTYFFAALPGVTRVEVWDAAQEQAKKDRLERDRARAFPFVFHPGAAPKQVKPQPDWQKREFNGHEYFYIPLPSSEQPDDKPKEKSP